MSPRAVAHLSEPFRIVTSAPPSVNCRGTTPQSRAALAVGVQIATVASAAHDQVNSRRLVDMA